MGLNWVRLDTSWIDHPKVDALRARRGGYRAIVVWLGALAYAGKHATAGYLPPTVTRSLDANPGDMRALVDVGLLELAPGGGWLIHDWTDYQPGVEVTAIRRERARKAARARWHPDDARHPD